MLAGFTYIIAGLTYGAVAVSQTECHKTWPSASESEVRAVLLVYLMACLLMWPVYLFDDIKAYVK